LPAEGYRKTTAPAYRAALFLGPTSCGPSLRWLAQPVTPRYHRNRAVLPQRRWSDLKGPSRM